MAKANSNNNKLLENGLPVLGGDHDTFDYSSSSNNKCPPFPSRASSQASRRTPTPAKQISLTAVKRREDSFYQEDDPSKIEELRTSMKLEAERSFLKEPTDMTDFIVERNTVESQEKKMKKPGHSCWHNGDVETEVQREKKQAVAQKPKKEEVKTKQEEKKEESSSSDEDSDEEEEEKKAPNQLLMEFLECIYAKDYENAAKLCKMILIYEPDHPVALQFQPVIAEKIQLDLEAEEEGSGESGSDDEDDDSGEEEDDDSDDSDDDSSDENSDENEDENDNDVENEDNQNSDNSNSGVGETEDSGIASTESSDRDNFYEM